LAPLDRKRRRGNLGPHPEPRDAKNSVTLVKWVEKRWARHPRGSLRGARGRELGGGNEIAGRSGSREGSGALKRYLETRVAGKTSRPWEATASFDEVPSSGT